MKKYFALKQHLHKALLWGAGLFAFIWLLVRSGQNPKRLAYPCQQTAFPLASAWFLVTTGFFTSLFSTKNLKIKIAVLVAGFFVIAGGGYYVYTKKFPPVPKVQTPLTWQTENPVSKVFLLQSIQEEKKSLNNPESSNIPLEYLSDKPMDDLFELMRKNGLDIYKTAANTNGLIPDNAIVVIKGNFQWDYRLGTNTDRIKGLIWAILNHPEGFKGEVLVCENTQYEGRGIGDNTNNSFDPEQSIADVTNAFKNKGYKVDLVNWTKLNEIAVNEYTEGDYTSGYVFEEQTKLSYPKFTSPYNSKISAKNGVWDENTNTYDSSRLVIINFPVLKVHSIMGATIALKNWIGLISLANLEERFGDYETMHEKYFFSEYALPARSMAQTFPELTIVDATWISFMDNYTNWNGNFIHAGMMLASTDPLAVSWYASKHILTPVALSPENANPDGQGSYGTIFNHFVNYLRDSTHFVCTTDSTKISIITY
ncbi:MAG: DUF362 domain-containing protein [Bacteroidales bacterium]|nr:DUF362 domain-containing protein [Bacteroidales bacterium]